MIYPDSTNPGCSNLIKDKCILGEKAGNIFLTAIESLIIPNGIGFIKSYMFSEFQVSVTNPGFQIMVAVIPFMLDIQIGGFLCGLIPQSAEPRVLMVI
jgi:hypothetical protein